MSHANHQTWTDRAQAVLPAGGFGNFDPGIVIARGKGARVWDTDGNEYIDYLIGSGPMMLGHGHPEIVDAVQSQLGNGMTFFASNTHGIELAEEICRAVACAEQVRYTSTGSEADLYAIRLARAATGRDKIIKFEGGYHGMSAEAQMSLAPAQLANFPTAVPDSAGIPDSVRDDVLIAPYNDIDMVRSLIAEHRSEIACIIVEPLQRIIQPAPGFLEALRDECTKNGIVLIFDEVVTGFRLAYGGAQEAYSVTPDLCTLGKIIGGGFPLAAVAGRADIMEHFDRDKSGEKFLMQIGTLSGNPIAAVAGLKTMEILRRDGQYEKLAGIGNTLQAAFAGQLTKVGIPHTISGHFSMFDIVFTDKPVKNYRDVIAEDPSWRAPLNNALRTNGILKSPAKLYVPLEVTDEDLDQSCQAIETAVGQIATK